MKKITFISLLSLLFSSLIYAGDGEAMHFDTSVMLGESITSKQGPWDFYPCFDDNPLITSKMRDKMRPYLAPLNHPAKLFLDSLFEKGNITKNEDSFKKAGFITVSRKTSSYVRVAKHPNLPGYLIKVYLDNERRHRGRKQSWKAFTDRCEGAANIRKLIQKENMRHFSVPDKWIYPMPVPEDLLPSAKKHSVLLIVTDMDLVSYSSSKQAWAEVVTREHLDELYSILSHGYASTFLSGNIPYTKSGKFSCVDTEFPKRKLDYSKVEKYLSLEMLNYWLNLVHFGGR